MPWKEIGVMDQKREFVFRALGREQPFIELCREYCICTKTGYKWLERFKERGYKGLEELSRKPHQSSVAIPPEVVIDIVALKNKHRAWGSKKIRQLYHKLHPTASLPVVSTFTHIFERVGLVEKKKRKRYPLSARIQKRIIPSEPNDVWTVDFKGWWYTTKKERINPLTVRDEYSKGILSIKVMDKGNISFARKEFERLFTRYGLPKCIRSDNGPPFASHFNALGLTKLSVWWMSLGIQLDRIDPGCPYQNGGHERMHRDMAKELEGHILGDMVEHQKAFDIWRDMYNKERPHEALGMKCPSDVYKLSERKYNPRTEELEYGQAFRVRKVNNRGVIRYNNMNYFIGNPFDGYRVGIRYVDGGDPEIWFARFFLGHINAREGLIEYQIGNKVPKVN